MLIRFGGSTVNTAPPNKLMLGGKNTEVSTSRVPLDMESIEGQPSGASVLPKQQMVLPDTGIPVVDQANGRLSSVVQYAPEAVHNTASFTFKGALYGGVCGALISLVTQWMSLFSIFTKKWPTALFKMGAILVPFGAIAGGIIGFHNSRTERQEMKELLFSGSFKRKA